MPSPAGTFPVFASLSSPKTPGRRLVSQGWWQGLAYGWQPYTHCFLHIPVPLLPPLSGLDWVYHSTGIGSHFLPYDDFIAEREVYEKYRIDVPAAEFVDLLNTCARESCTKYPKLEVVGIFVARALLVLSGGHIDLKHNPFARGEQQKSCGETLQRLLVKLVPGFQWKKDSDLISPFDTREGLVMMTAEGLVTLTYKRDESHLSDEKLSPLHEAVRLPKKRMSVVNKPKPENDHARTDP